MKSTLIKIFGLALCLMLAATSVLAESVDPNVAGEEVSLVASLIGTFAPMVIILVVFWLFLIRPQRKKDKQVKDMLANLKVGDRVCTIGGIYGTIVNIKEDTITLAIGQKNQAPTEMTVARWAIRQVEEVIVENDGEVLA